MKQTDSFFAIWGGIAGIQSTLAVLLERGLPLSDIARVTATNPAKRFGIADRGSIQVGQKADFVLVDLAASYTLQPDDLLQRHRVSPYAGRRFKGVVRRTYRDGELIYADGKIVCESRGKLVRPNHAKTGTHT
jgi:allantoinase